MNDLSFARERAILERAMSSPAGIRVKAASPGHAVSLRQQLNRARVADRELYAKAYPDPDNPQHGRSPYDILEIRLGKRGTADETFITIVPREAINLEIEELEPRVEI